MATKIGDLFFNVYANVSDAAKSLDGLGNKFVSTGNAASRAIGQTVANATAIAVGATALLTAEVLKTGAAYNTLGQSATAAFSTVYDDIQAASGILQEISQLNLETPFRGSSLVRTARTLAGFGVEEENVIRITEALTEAIAGLGLGAPELQRVAIQFGQIQSRGRLAGDEARALANYGIDAFGILADALDLPVQKVRELSEEFKLTADVAIPALISGIEDRFGGGTERLFATAAGQAEGLRAVFEALGSALVEPFIGFAGGGAVVTGLSQIRLELVQLVSVASDGSFVLEGFLAPLTPVMESLADATVRASSAMAGFIGSLDETTIPQILNELSGLGPLIAGLGGGLAAVFVQAIPFIGRFAAGFNPIVVGISAMILASGELRSTFSAAFAEIAEMVEPLIPQIQELLRGLVDLAEEAGPAIADILVESFRLLVPIISELLSATNELLPIIGPALVAVLEVTADVFGVVADIAEVLGSELTTVITVLGTLIYLFPQATAVIIFATTNMKLMAFQTGLAATAFGTLATAVGVALAALGSYQAISAGIRGDIGYLNEDVPFYEKPFQLAGRFGFALTGGDRELFAETAAAEAGFEAAENFNLALLGTVETFAEARAAAAVYATQLGLTETGIDNFANTVALAWHEVQEEQRIATFEANRWTTAAGRQHGGANRLRSETNELAGALGELSEETFTSADFLKLLTEEADAAWAAVERLGSAGRDATLDDFLRELPGLAQDLTDALALAPGILRDLEVGAVLGDVRGQAVAVIQQLAEEWGVGVAEIEALLDERGLSAVIAALGEVTVQTTETVDPLVAKYSELGATASQLRDALAKLNDERQTAIRAQIDQVEAALDNAREAADRAREAVADFLSGGYLNSPQALVDNLIGDIGNIGSAVEEGLLQGGVRGDAAVRSALGGLQSQLAAIVNAGVEQGLNGQQIATLLAPVLGAIDEEVGDAARRIVTQDWTQGISGGAGSALAQALAAGLDAGAIQGLINDILGADASVAGLESQLEGLQASLKTDVEFSPAQVQEALDEIQTIVTTEATITPEAAQLVYDEIQNVFDDDDLIAAVDQALITQQILDAAQAAEDQINLVFRSNLSFNSSEIQALGALVGGEFYTAFNQQMQQLRDEQAVANGFDSYASMVAALGPAVAGATISGQPVLNQTINQNVQVNGAQSPIATGSEVVAAASAAAGSGGAYDPTKYVRTSGVFVDGGNSNPKGSGIPAGAQ